MFLVRKLIHSQSGAAIGPLANGVSLVAQFSGGGGSYNQSLFWTHTCFASIYKGIDQEEKLHFASFEHIIV